MVDLAGDGPMVVVGSSVGGSCALEVARLAPDRVAAVVLVGAKAGHRPEPGFRDAAVRLLTDGGMAAGWPRYWEPLFGARADPTLVEHARRLAFRQDIDDVIRGVQVFHGRRDLSDFAREWPKPLIVISGDQDRTPSPATTARLASDAAAGTFHLVADAGHYVTFERPRSFDAIVRQAVLDVERGA